MGEETDLIARMAELKGRLDEIRPVRGEVLERLAKWYDVKLTYASNAIEGNTLTHSETQIVVEEGITIGGKTVREHLEAVDLFEATRGVREMARARVVINEASVLRLHEMVLRRSEPGRAGTYADANRRVTGSDVVFPRPEKIPGLMDAFGTGLGQATGWRGAIEAHFGLVTIHPFNDGNGRTARLLMNAILMRDGYAPVVIGPPERARYVKVVGDRQRAEPLGHGLVDDATREAYSRFMVERIVDSLEDHLEALGMEVGRRKGESTREAPPRPGRSDGQARPGPSKAAPRGAADHRKGRGRKGGAGIVD
jgi:Fic family protein